MKQKNAVECDENGRSTYEKAEQIEGYTKQLTQEAVGTAICQALMALKTIRKTSAENIQGREE